MPDIGCTCIGSCQVLSVFFYVALLSDPTFEMDLIQVYYFSFNSVRWFMWPTYCIRAYYLLSIGAIFMPT